MLVPEYWAEARVQGQRDGRPVTVRRFGWSDTSQLEAQANADSRAHAALARILSGEFLPRRDLKRPYNGSEGVPIREEIVERRGDTIITRNSYGALCLNTPDCLFADIDFQEGPGWRLVLMCGIVLLLVGLAVGLPLHPVLAVVAVGAALIYAFPVAALVNRISTKMGGGSEVLARRRIENFIQQNPQWHLRLYRTPAGLRVMALHDQFDPANPVVAQFFQAIGADPIYVRMCFRQECFRARVSPKPWRIGLGEHITPRTVWPIDADKMPQRRRWIERYEQAARQFASCRFLDSLGSGIVHPQVREVQKLHDDLCQVDVPLPLA